MLIAISLPYAGIIQTGKGLWNLFHVSANLAPLAYFIFCIVTILLANTYQLQFKLLFI